MTQDNNSQEERIANSFEAGLNSHGYSFQSAILKAARKAAESNNSRWYFLAREFPIEVQGQGSRIDFVLKHMSERVPIYLVAECKRTNPALSSWGFAKTDFISWDRTHEPFIVERLTPWSTHQPSQIYITLNSGYDDKVYNIGFDFKSGQTGDATGPVPGRGGAIEEAASQALRGLNGMVEFLAKNSHVWYQDNKVPAVVLPVIFTTADLWATDVAPSSADIKTGKIKLPKNSLTKHPWLAYQYHMSPGLKHSLSPIRQGNTFGEIMDLEYVRTIPIVSPSGIETFLQWASRIDVWHW